MPDNAGPAPLADNAGPAPLTVAQAAARLGTTVPRLRRLLARPALSDCSRLGAIQTRRGTRTGTVVPVPRLPALREALQTADGPSGAETSGAEEQEQEQGQGDLRPFSRREAAALDLALRQTRITLAAKDQTIAAKDQAIAGQARELAAKDEIIGLLRDKLAALGDTQGQTQGQTQGRPQGRPEGRPVPRSETRPLGFWDRLLGRR